MIRIAASLFFAITIFGFSSLGTDFFFCYPSNYQRGVAAEPEPMDHYDGLLILTSSYPTTGTVSNSTGSFTVGFTIAADDVRTVIIDSTHWLAQSEVVEDKGLRIQTDEEITAYFLSYATPGATNDMALLFPTTALGTEYLVMSSSDNVCTWNTTYDSSPSYLAIVAVEDGTNITITPSCATEGGVSGGVPFSIILNQHETYQVYASTPDPGLFGSLDSTSDLTGTEIISDKPIAVYGGVSIGIVPDEIPAGDFLIEQIPPIVAWGQEFCAFPVETRNDWQEDMLRILASEDATTVDIEDAGGTTTITLNRGEYYDWNGPCTDTYSDLFPTSAPYCSGLTLDSPTYISADKPVLCGNTSWVEG